MILDFSMKATSTFPWNVSAWNISASVRSLRDGVQRSCEKVASKLFGYIYLAIEAVQEGGGATLPMLSTFCAGCPGDPAKAIRKGELASVGLEAHEEKVSDFE